MNTAARKGGGRVWQLPCGAHDGFDRLDTAQSRRRAYVDMCKFRKRDGTCVVIGTPSLGVLVAPAGAFCLKRKLEIRPTVPEGMFGLGLSADAFVRIGQPGDVQRGVLCVL